MSSDDARTGGRRGLFGRHRGRRNRRSEAKDLAGDFAAEAAVQSAVWWLPRLVGAIFRVLAN